LELGHRHAGGRRNPLHEVVQGRPGSAQAERVAGVRIGVRQQPLDERAAPQDAGIGRGRRPGLP